MTLLSNAKISLPFCENLCSFCAKKTLTGLGIFWPSFSWGDAFSESTRTANCRLISSGNSHLKVLQMWMFHGQLFLFFLINTIF